MYVVVWSSEYNIIAIQSCKNYYYDVSRQFLFGKLWYEKKSSWFIFCLYVHTCNFIVQVMNSSIVCCVGETLVLDSHITNAHGTRTQIKRNVCFKILAFITKSQLGINHHMLPFNLINCLKLKDRLQFISFKTFVQSKSS